VYFLTKVDFKGINRVCQVLGMKANAVFNDG
jgi:hypothetical protein